MQSLILILHQSSNVRKEFIWLDLWIKYQYNERNSEDVIARACLVSFDKAKKIILDEQSCFAGRF